MCRSTQTPREVFPRREGEKEQQGNEAADHGVGFEIEIEIAFEVDDRFRFVAGGFPAAGVQTIRVNPQIGRNQIRLESSKFNRATIQTGWFIFPSFLFLDALSSVRPQDVVDWLDLPTSPDGIALYTIFGKGDDVIL